MNHKTELIEETLKRGATRGLHSFFWIAKILVPISLLTALLQWSGLLSKLNFLVEPVMRLLGLPAIAAYPILAGLLSSVYAGIASMMVLPFTKTQMTLMAIFILIAHSLIPEGFIQAKSGVTALKATLFRLAAAFVTVLVVRLFIDSGAVESVFTHVAGPSSESFPQMMSNWFHATLSLTLKVFLIIMAILILLEFLKTFDLIGPVVNFFSPVLKLLGLERKVGMLWITAVVFGLAYGGAVIMEEARKGEISGEDLEALHLSIGINHSMVEDPSLFAALGLSPFWLLAPRLICAILAVRLLKIWRRFVALEESTGPQPQAAGSLSEAKESAFRDPAGPSS